MWITRPTKVACVILGLHDHIGWIKGKEIQLQAIPDLQNANTHERLEQALQHLGPQSTHTSITLYLEQELNADWKKNSLPRLKKQCLSKKYLLNRVVNWPIQLSLTIAEKHSLSSTIILTNKLCILLCYEKNQCYYQSITQRIISNDQVQLTLLSHALSQHKKAGSQLTQLISNNPNDCQIFLDSGIQVMPYPWKPKEWGFLHS